VNPASRLYSRLDPPPFSDFPHTYASRFRERLLVRRNTFSTDDLLTEVSIRLGPSEEQLCRCVICPGGPYAQHDDLCCGPGASGDCHIYSRTGVDYPRRRCAVDDLTLPPPLTSRGLPAICPACGDDACLCARHFWPLGWDGVPGDDPLRLDPLSKLLRPVQVGPQSWSSDSFHACTCQTEKLKIKAFSPLNEQNEVDMEADPSNGRFTTNNPFSVLSEENEPCIAAAMLSRKAKALVRWYSRIGLPQEREPPPHIECGGLRAAVRQVFPASLPAEWELSFKTIQKIEKDCCKPCRPRFEKLLDDWNKERFQPVEVDEKHLDRFTRAFAMNIDTGWDDRRRPFIPNGHATLYATRREGGNWNVEPFEDFCSPTLVFSSGKPRVVTLYSSENTKVLAPLHYSLFSHIKRKGWLLVGDPTNEHVNSLTGADFLSYDYISATDRIKTRYVRAAIEVLISKAGGLTVEEERALRVLGNLRIERHGPAATRGQPMGSVMSFPLLCLINKTVVDLSIYDLLERGEISFPEAVSHPLKLNGDDLLVREVRSETDLDAAIVRNGSAVGLAVNKTKSMRSRTLAEVNSTLFRCGEKVKKLNVSALWMKPDVTDVLGYALESTTNSSQFVKVVRANAHILAKQSDKMIDVLPPTLRKACRRVKKIREACCALPVSVKPVEEGFIRMAVRPGGYFLSRDEENRAMSDEIERVRAKALASFPRERTRFTSRSIPSAQSFQTALKPRHRLRDVLIPECYVRQYYLKLRENGNDSLTGSVNGNEEDFGLTPTLPLPEHLVPVSLGKPLVFRMTDYIRSQKCEVVRPLVKEVEEDFISFGFSDDEEMNDSDCSYDSFD